MRTSLLSLFLGFAALTFGCSQNSNAPDRQGSPAADSEAVQEVADVTPETEAVPVSEMAGDPQITVYKSPTCGCCSLWVEHLEENGFVVQSVETDNLHSVRSYYGIPADMSACHTAVIDGYVVEGHVPAEDVHRLIDEKPEAIGIAVPGMPIGSPGMEVEGRPADEYNVYLLTEDGTSVFASH
ncbi:MAG: DUF411 domain-containing protein [Rubricoccaceae bacterium]|nr:DUF411 domain-containing protein [Rubricoccaceae bacterium]